MSTQITRPVDTPAPVRRSQRAVAWPEVWVAAAVAVAALTVRLVPLLRGGGLTGLGNYDDGVYFGAAIGLAHGLLPYRDFLLLHPPGIAVLLLPFAAVGRLVGQPDAFAAARVAFVALGSANAVLVTRVLRPAGRLAALTGGLFYAGCYAAAFISHSTLLETPATTCLLVAVLLVLRMDRGSWTAGSNPIRLDLLAGGLLGVSAGIKIWGVVLAAAVVVWVGATLGVRRALQTVLGVGAGATLICLPFFLAAPRPMWQMVVLDQLGRARSLKPESVRVSDILGLTALQTPVGPVSTASWVGVALVVGLSVLAVRQRVGRLGVVLLATGTALLFASPSWFVHYASVTAAPLAVVLGAAVATALPAVRPRVRAVGAVVLITGLLAYALPVLTSTFGQPFPAARLRPVVAALPGCVTSDDPTVLIELGVIERNLDRGCPYVVDLRGYGYHLHAPGVSLPREDNPAWQAYALRYLGDGDATVLVALRRGFSFDPASAALVDRWPVLASADGFVLRGPRAER